MLQHSLYLESVCTLWFPIQMTALHAMWNRTTKVAPIGCSPFQNRVCWETFQVYKIRESLVVSGRISDAGKVGHCRKGLTRWTRFGNIRACFLGAGFNLYLFLLLIIKGFPWVLAMLSLFSQIQKAVPGLSGNALSHTLHEWNSFCILLKVTWEG